MRDRDTIDAELRRLAALRRSLGEPSSRQIDALLDERLGHRPEVFEAETVDAGSTSVGVNTWSQPHKVNEIAPRRRTSTRRRFSMLGALPLSLIAAGAVFAVLFAVSDRHQAAQPGEVLPSSEPPSAAAPKPAAPPPTSAPQPSDAPPLALVDKAFIETLKQEGVPVPSNDYVMAQGHAVCDFLGRQPDLTEAARSVQRSTIWDENQSTQFAAGAVVSYCPQYQFTGYQPAIPDQLQQTFQKAQSDLQAIEGDLHSIRDALPGGPP